MGDFQCRVAPSCQAVAPGKRGSTGPGVFPPGRGGGSGWSAGRQGLRAGHRGGYLAGPGTVLGEPQPEVAAAPDESSGDGEQAQAEPSGFPRAGGPGQGEQLAAGQQLAGHRDDLAPHWFWAKPAPRPAPACAIVHLEVPSASGRTGLRQALSFQPKALFRCGSLAWLIPRRKPEVG